jgi:hypothetical protein
MAERYILRVTAGPGYDAATHVQVPVNEPEPVRIKGDAAEIELNVRIQNYGGLPLGSPSTSPYFATEPHAKNSDQYSSSFRCTRWSRCGAHSSQLKGPRPLVGAKNTGTADPVHFESYAPSSALSMPASRHIYSWKKLPARSLTQKAFNVDGKDSWAGLRQKLRFRMYTGHRFIVALLEFLHRA